MNSWFDRWSGRLPSTTRRLSYYAYAFAIATLIAIGGYWLEEEGSARELRATTIEAGHRHAREMGDVVARQMEALIQGFDLTLLQLRESRRRGNDADFENAVLVAIGALQDKSIQGVVVTDAGGRVVSSSISTAQRGVYLGDRDYFAAQARASDDTLFIGTPVRSRLLDSWSIPISRPLRVNGRFAGVIVIGIKPEYFADRLIDPRLSRQDVVSIIHPDGAFLARNQRLDQVLGTRAPADRPFLGNDAPYRGDFEADSPVDARPRIFAWQRVPGTSVVVNVGLDTQTLMAPIEAGIARGRMQAGFVSALLALFGASVSGLLLRTARNHRLLRESESRYRSAFEENSSIKLLIDPRDGRIVDANDAAVAFYGYPRATLLERRFGDLTCASAAEIATFLAQALGAERRQTVFVQRLASGATRRVETYTGPIAVRGATLLFSVIHDVTDRHATEQQLKLAASLFAHTHEGVFYCDAEGRILDVNDAFVGLTGHPRIDCIGMDLRYFDGARNRADDHEVIWRGLRQHGNWRGEVWIRTRSGNLLVELLDLSAITDESGVATGYVGVLSDITSLKETERHLEHMAHFDALTGLPNRVLMADRLNQALRGAERQRELLAVAVLDLDGFKPVNDNHGHQAGDEVLIEVAHRLAGHVRSADTVSRIGGDEFVILLRDLGDSSEASRVLTRIVDAISVPYRIGTIEVGGVSASIGYALFPDDAVDGDRLLALADAAMYDAKRSGGRAVRRNAGAALVGVGGAS